jgi:putative transcriptional regulator
MTKKAFDKIAAGLEEAILIARGETKPARLHVPEDLEVKAIRAKTGFSQEAFAAAFGFTIEQIRAWEQGRARPLGGVRAYLMMIGQDHDSVARLLAATRGKDAA